jgi:primosomal protein N'
MSRDALPCPDCTYDLRGLMSNRCPECGLLLRFARATEPEVRYEPYSLMPCPACGLRNVGFLPARCSRCRGSFSWRERVIGSRRRWRAAGQPSPWGGGV